MLLGVQDSFYHLKKKNTKQCKYMSSYFLMALKNSEFNIQEQGTWK